jgi:hypothetical protein
MDNRTIQQARGEADEHKVRPFSRKKGDGLGAQGVDWWLLWVWGGGNQVRSLVMASQGGVETNTLSRERTCGCRASNHMAAEQVRGGVGEGRDGIME